MQYKVYGVIEIGGYTASLNIYEISRKNGLRILDRMSYPIELGRDSYASGKISQDTANELCTIIREFAQAMKGYQVDAYIAVRMYLVTSSRKVRPSLTWAVAVSRFLCLTRII